MIIRSSVGILTSFLLSTLPVMATECPHPNGEWIATEHFAATLMGEMAERITLYVTPAGQASSAYGLGQDPVIAIAEACINNVKWTQIKFPAERYSVEAIAWVQASLIKLH